MSVEERRAVTLTATILLIASFARFLWEARPVPPILPPSELPAALIDETRREVEEEERMRTPLAEGERVDPNRDPEFELARLPGIGPALAGRIVADRDAHGGFRVPDDLLRVSGIGTSTLERIRPLLDLSDPPMARNTTRPGEASQDAELRAGRDPVRPIDVNRASATELEVLPGVGTVLAGRIVEIRNQKRGFARVEDLREVPGIGEATLQRLRPFVRVQR